MARRKQCAVPASLHSAAQCGTPTPSRTSSRFPLLLSQGRSLYDGLAHLHVRKCKHHAKHPCTTDIIGTSQINFPKACLNVRLGRDKPASSCIHPHPLKYIKRTARCPKITFYASLMGSRRVACHADELASCVPRQSVAEVYLGNVPPGITRSIVPAPVMCAAEECCGLCAKQHTESHACRRGRRACHAVAVGMVALRTTITR